MLTPRTDLAAEARQLWQQSAKEATELAGVEARDDLRQGFRQTRIHITSPQGARALGKPEGTYLTLYLDDLERREEDAFSRAVHAVADALEELLPPEGAILVAGLGNRAITPDAVGPMVHDHTLVTRHLADQLAGPLAGSRPVAALSAGVLGTTGVESCQLIRAVADSIAPGCVVAVDALASRSVERVCTTVQLSDTGISPGSGVGNHRSALNRETLGVPVIAVGVPTVVDAATLTADILAQAGQPQLDPDALAGLGGSLMVTPRDIDSRVADLSKVIGYGITLAANPGLTLEELELLLS